MYVRTSQPIAAMLAAGFIIILKKQIQWQAMSAMSDAMQCVALVAQHCRLGAPGLIVVMHFVVMH